jgi:hypothetical protein
MKKKREEKGKKDKVTHLFIYSFYLFWSFLSFELSINQHRFDWLSSRINQNPYEQTNKQTNKHQSELEMKRKKGKNQRTKEKKRGKRTKSIINSTIKMV